MPGPVVVRPAGSPRIPTPAPVASPPFTTRWERLANLEPIAVATELPAALIFPLRRQLRISVQIEGSSLATIPGLRVGSNSVIDTVVGNYGSASSEDNAVKTSIIGTIAKLALAVASNTSRRYLVIEIQNYINLPKRVIIRGYHSPLDAAATALVLFAGVALWTGLPQINTVQLWSGTAATTLSINTAMEVWGSD